jgi:thiol-disulfide isomerase/thioredoxin
MKKTLPITLFIALLISAISANCQSTGMDFECEECTGPSHHLYTELDQGNVVIIDYVMLNCAPCVLATTALNKIMTEYESKGRVKFYSFAFADYVNCDQMMAWKRNSYFTQPVFIKGGTQVTYYGGMGMPTIVVLGTNEHKVFFKGVGYTPEMDAQIRTAIDSALLYSPVGLEEVAGSDRFNAYPTVFTDNLNITTNKVPQQSEAVIFDASGRKVKSVSLPETGKTNVNTTDLSKGFYFVRLKSTGLSSESVKLIKE